MAALRPSELSKKIVHKYLGLASTDPLPIIPNRSSMNVMLWNCQGASNKIFRRNFRELVRLHHPNVVALFETKVFFSSIGLFFNHLGFTTSTIVDPVGRVGGIWLIWDPSQVSVSAHVANSQVIQAIVKRENYEDWVLATVYASLNIGMRQNLWNELENSANTIGSPWLVAGNFNDIMGQNERRSFSQNRQNYRCRKFLDNINRCGLMDLGCTSSKFTWSKNRQGMANTMERLDRALCNAEWRTTFPEGAVKNLPRTYSDHLPLMVYTEDKVATGKWIRLKASKNSPPISHLFFADDLLLFAKADQINCETILETMNEFCCISRYLGVPLIHSRVSKNIFNGVIEKIQRKLSSWKAKALSLAGRATVIQAVSSSIPTYLMQTTKLPQSICKHIHKLNRNFLWGDQEGRKKVYLVNWKQVCKAKQDKGLGLRRAEDQNVALLAKLGWNLNSDKDASWTKILRGKYLHKHTFSNWPSTTNASHTWRSIMKTSAILAKGTKWSVGNGKSISFWKDWWCGNGPLASTFPGPHITEDVVVAAIINEEGKWDMEGAANVLPQLLQPQIQQIHLPQFVELGDNPYWIGSSTGGFIVGAAYKLVANQVSSLDTGPVIWHWIWKLKIPQKLKGFIWLLMLNKVLTNHQRKIRGLTTDDTCPRCQLYCEDLSHLLRECHQSAEVWETLTHHSWRSPSTLSSLDTWLQHNLKSKNRECFNIPWDTVFVVTLWRLWKARNNVVFNQEAIHTQELVRQIQHEAAKIHYAFHTDHFTGDYLHFKTNWCPPCAGKIKLNTDGCSKGNPGPAGYGGLCRDARGTWIFGFHGKLESVTSEEAELWGIYRGLTIILEKNMRDVLIETDAEQVVIHINSTTPSNYPYRALLEDIKFLMHRCNCAVRHILREGNQCANRLANIRVSHGDNQVVLDNPPPEIANLLVADIVGLSCERA
ncbi:unnamed protein product [Camellia sinensis]